MIENQRRPTRHIARLVVILVAIAASVSSPTLALAATPDEAASGVSDGGVYVEPGAEDVDVPRLRDVIAEAATADLEVSVVVLAEAADAVAFASAVNDRVPGTVLVFTPDAYGVASNELAQATLNDALDEAADDLSSPNLVDGVEAFVDAATPTNTNWGLIVVLAIVAVAAIGVGGRVIERRATRGRRAAALRREWGQLEARADLLASPVLDLSTRVELDGGAALAERYRIAAGRYGEIRDALGRDPSADAVEEIQSDLDDLERRLDELEAALDAAAE
ncbi:MAG: hypothetical protein QNJ88_16940 [Acidimicrobiia bacterium]|nr:hypothetical protein [Acidimicrobiia bacterium]